MRRRMSPLAVIAIIFGSFALIFLIGVAWVWSTFIRPFMMATQRSGDFPQVNLNPDAQSRTVQVTVNASHTKEEIDCTIDSFSEDKQRPLEKMPLHIGIVKPGGSTSVVLHFDRPFAQEPSWSPGLSIYKVSWRSPGGQHGSEVWDGKSTTEESGGPAHRRM